MAVPRNAPDFNITQAGSTCQEEGHCSLLRSVPAFLPRRIILCGSIVGTTFFSSSLRRISRVPRYETKKKKKKKDEREDKIIPMCFSSILYKYRSKFNLLKRNIELSSGLGSGVCYCNFPGFFREKINALKVHEN